ncbi:mCG148183 [Mus musculus]|nr:mCG148183 [Mus musculus]
MPCFLHSTGSVKYREGIGHRAACKGQGRQSRLLLAGHYNLAVGRTGEVAPSKPLKP